MAFVLNEEDDDLLLTNNGDRDRKPLGVYSVYDDGSIDLAMTRVYLPRIEDPNVIAMYIDEDEGFLAYTELAKDKLWLIIKYLYSKPSSFSSLEQLN